MISKNNGLSSHSLESTDHLTVAEALTDMQLESLRSTEPQIADRLQKLRDAVWHIRENSNLPSTRNELFAEMLRNLPSDQKNILIESYARMGHLYDLAGLTARDNYFVQLEAQGKAIPGGVEEFVDAQDGVKTSIAKLNVPELEITKTKHPTNVQALPPMQRLRRIAVAIRKKDWNAVRQEVVAYQDTSLLHQVNGKEANLTVRDETDTVLNFLGNIYEDFPGIFAQYDKALNKKAKQTGEVYDPLALNLKLRLGSWGSAGDKDGNNQVTSEKTLEAIALHTRDIVQRYHRELEAINSPSMMQWHKKLDEALVLLNGKEGKPGLVTRVEKLRMETDTERNTTIKKNGAATEFSRRFDALSRELAQLRNELQPKKDTFEQALTSAYKQASGVQKDALLSLVRKARIFGFNFSKIEYRETAERHQQVLGSLIEGYKDMTPEQKKECLSEYLTGKRPLHELETQVDRILEDGNSNPYSKNDAGPIAYHTLKRMQLARDHGDMIKDMVLAECGKLDSERSAAADIQWQGVTNILEAQLLQRLVRDRRTDKQPSLGIIPLFEEPNTMEHIGDIMKTAYKNEAYKSHMEALASIRHGEQKTQQIQIAHSDNRRRTGAFGACGYIHDAHKKARAAGSECGVRTQFFEGGSISDPYRNGVRALSATVNAFALHDFAKFTFQGGDLLNYFNHPGSNERMFTRHFVHPATRVHQENGAWVVGRNGDNGEYVKNGKLDRRPNTIVDEVAIKALKRTRDDYTQDDFNDEGLGILLKVIGVGYDRESMAGNRGSRAPSRDKVVFEKADSMQLGAVHMPQVEEVKPIDLSGVRTIPFSKVPQQNKLNLSWVGAMKLGQYLYEAIKERVDSINAGKDSGLKCIKKDDIDSFMQAFGQIHTQENLTPDQFHFIYSKSPAFRDGIDRAAFGLARTDLDDIAANLDHKKDVLPKTKAAAKVYLEHLKKTYQTIGEVAYEALMGKDRKTADNQRRYLRHYKSEEAKVQADAVQTLNGLGEQIVRKNNYQDFLVAAKLHLDALDKEKEHTHLSDRMLGVITAGVNAAVHSRWLEADDPALAEYRQKHDAQSAHHGQAI